MTLEQYFEAKREFEEDHEKRAKLIKDRETFLVYKGEGAEEEEDDSEDEEEDGSGDSEIGAEEMM